MADIMLVLLIIFMITAPLLSQGVTVNLPKAKNPLDAPEADREDAVMLALTREGRLYFNKNPIQENELPSKLSEWFSNKTEKWMFIRSDSAVPYGRVVDVVNTCRQAGIERIGLMAEKLKEAGAPVR
jgi:biopolymer transport protein ExbD/biopolymer transport protein TolR